MKIAIGCDHGALDLKNAVIAHLESKNYEVANYGTDTLDSCDYPDYVGAAAKAVVKKPLGVFFPLVALNSAVLGVALNNAAEGLSLLQALVSSVAVGLGFLLAMVLFCGLRSRIDESNTPAPFRGLAVTLIAASFISLAFMGFGGIVENIFA